MIQITNYQFYQYNITYNIDQNQVIGIYCVNNKLLKNILLEISGINKTKGIYYQSKNVFDNIAYFNERIYLDCNKQLYNTLMSSKISDDLYNKYNIICNSDQLKHHIKQLQIRSEGKLKRKYYLSKQGISLMNNALALSIYKYPILLNPLENIDSIIHLNYLKQQYKNKKALVGITNLKKYVNCLDKLILLGYKNTYILSLDEPLIILQNVLMQDLIISECQLDNLIIHKCIKNENIIIYNKLSGSQISKLHKLNVKMKEIDVYQLGDYIC